MNEMNRRQIMIALLAFVAISGAVWYLVFPLGYPIYLMLPGEQSSVERRVCGAWYPEGSGQWWLIVERGGVLDKELRNATGIKFEIDNGSGLSEVELAKEEPYRPDSSSVAHAIYPGCSRFLVSRSAPAKLTAIHLERRRP
jgi:hypothetical protein